MQFHVRFAEIQIASLATLATLCLGGCLEDEAGDSRLNNSGAVPTENSAPEISGEPSTIVAVGDEYSFEPVATDADGDDVSFAITNRPSWSIFDTSSGRLSGTPTFGDVGTNAEIVISVSDGIDSNSLAPFSITVENGDTNSPPTISGTPATRASEGRQYTFTPTANDADGDPLSFSISGRPQWASFDSASGTLVGVPGADDVGVYNNIALSVSDGAASAFLAPFSITVENEDTNSPPTISGTPDTRVSEGRQYTFTPTANDADGDPLSFSISGRPRWASFDSASGALSGVPGNDDAGVYANIAISVSDGAASASLAPFSITVENVVFNSPPTISGRPATRVSEGQFYTFTPTANDADGDELSFSISGRPAWASFDSTSGRLAGVPGPDDAGVYANIVISVSDGASSASLAPFSITVEVEDTNSPPTISGTPAASVSEGQQYTFTPNANDADGDALTFSISGRPGWVSFDSSSGSLAGVPGADDVGVYSNIVISVSDGESTASLVPFSITVNATSLGSATLSWTPPTENEDGSALTDLAGYRIYWGTTPGEYSDSVTIDNPGISTYVVENLGDGTYEFAATAVNSDGVESKLSNIASKTIP